MSWLTTLRAAWLILRIRYRLRGASPEMQERFIEYVLVKKR